MGSDSSRVIESIERLNLGTVEGINEALKILGSSDKVSKFDRQNDAFGKLHKALILYTLRGDS